MTAQAGQAGSRGAEPSAPDLEGGGGGPGLVDADRSAVVRWNSRARSIEELTRELARMWASDPQTPSADADEAHVQARTSVLNLMVIARRPEMGERAAATISRLSGRHPSRTIILSPADPDGPRWVDAQVQAVCMVPADGGHETCAELIYLTAGGDAGRHLDALVAPLLIHDLPVATWWPGDTPFNSRQTYDLIDMSDRFIVDGSTWSGSGRDRLVKVAEICGPELTVCDFGLMRQSRWREAIASTFDTPGFLPYLRSLRRIAVTYATHDETGDPEGTNLVKPVYHVAWLASRLGARVSVPLHVSSRATAKPKARGRQAAAGPGGQPVPGGFDGKLRLGQSDVDVFLRPRLSRMPAGTTMRVELLCDRRGSELRTDVTAEAENVHVRVWQDGVEAMERRYHAPRRTDVDLLAETIERTGTDPVCDRRHQAGGRARPCARRGGTERMTDVSPAPSASEEPRVIVRPDPDAVAREAAEFIATSLAEAASVRGRADWVTTGGSTPVGIYPLLAREPLRSRVPWDQLHLWWSDDRFVPRDHPLSNVAPVEDILLRTAAWSGESGQGAQGDDIGAGLAEGAWIPPEHIHPFPTTEAIARGVGADWCAAAYERVLRDSGLRIADGWPAFDLILLGVGPDGHVMSVFPGSATLDSDAWTSAVPAPTHVEPHIQRVTLTPGVLPAAERILVVTTGASKAGVVGRIFGPERNERALPGQLVRRRNATWILDAEAAAELDRRG